MNEFNNENFTVIGIAGYARCGKDTFCKIASSVLSESGYEVKKFAFAEELKKLADPICKQLFGISAFTDDTDEKKVIRPGLVWIGCGLRENKDPNIWISKVNNCLVYEYERFVDENRNGKKVYFVSDVRFPNEADWIHKNWEGWVLHLSKFHRKEGFQGEVEQVFDEAPNAEEAKNDPLVKAKSDYQLEWEDVRMSDPSIKLSEIPNDKYMINTTRLCLSKCPFLKIKSDRLVALK